MGAVLHLYVPVGPLCRAALSLTAYLGFIMVLGVMVCVTPAQALISTTGYVRVATQASQLAYLQGHRAALISTVASAAATAPSAASLAVRMVTGPLGWLSLGVSAGAALMQIVYPQSDIASIQSASAPPAPVVIPNANLNRPGSTIRNAESSGYDQAVFIPNTGEYAGLQGCINLPPLTGLPAGWVGPYTPNGVWGTPTDPGCVILHASTAGAASKATYGAQVPPTAEQIQAFLNGLPATDPLAIETHTSPLGEGTTPAPASTVVSTPVSSTEIATQVVPASQVEPTDVVVNPNAVPPPGTPTTSTDTQTTTTTTSTTTNPDGSTTMQEESTAVTSCTTGEHDPRTLGTILQTHLDTWRGSGIAGVLSTLQLLTWPSTSPTYTVHSSLLGTFSFDFTAWNGIFVALRTLIIAGASFAAYRIIFVGGSGGSDE